MKTAVIKNIIEINRMVVEEIMGTRTEHQVVDEDDKVYTRWPLYSQYPEEAAKIIPQLDSVVTITYYPSLKKWICNVRGTRVASFTLPRAICVAALRYRGHNITAEGVEVLT